MKILHNIKEVNDAINKDLCLIVAKSHSCTVCNTANRLLENNVKDLDKIESYNIYVDDVDEFRGQHSIYAVPTVVIYSNGKELLRESRFINYDKIQRLIDLYTS